MSKAHVQPTVTINMYEWLETEMHIQLEKRNYIKFLLKNRKTAKLRNTWNNFIQPNFDCWRKLSPIFAMAW